jgi:hypothetical protein
MVPETMNAMKCFILPAVVVLARLATIAPAEEPRELFARGEKLAVRLQPQADPARFGPLTAELRVAKTQWTAAEQAGSVSEAVRKDTVRRARELVRKIAFCNPRLAGIQRLLFIKRHDPGGPYHMCDQYYGCNARSGGGLFILEGPFGDDPKLVDVLAESVVENGRLKGQKLTGGAFLSPELSYDGQTILFAYTEAKGKGPYEWRPDCCYHLFKVGVDGRGLTQLTDGPWDDFDPCFLPGGRVAFISERRGGYLRCGRHCPVYTLFSMEPDGSDIINLSYHETHEWHPSVNHDGMLVYTRWDYVDRDTNVAHHPWICYPDGRDPRSFHGNYPLRRESRPWMEMNLRAIPNSHKYVATAAGHHGHALGSLVIIDPRIEDDAAMSQVERLTPEVPFPEANAKRVVLPFQQYGTPWPLSEDDFLCTYDPQATNHAVYWIDRDGNRELIYRDPAIACESPIPLAARPRPPVLPDETVQTAAARRAHAAAGETPTATIALMNVYRSDFAWPAGTKIKALRVIQLLPKSTPPPNEPRIGVAEQTNARAVLGTVPVEADGSAYFEAPVGRPIYFQALDDRGMAVQSMRSATYVHPGERLVCQGCHEPRHQPISLAATSPAAMRRGPSPMRPEAEGSDPFNYPRLVQGVLDRNCAGCHRERKTLDLTGGVAANGFTRSYNSLAGKHGFYFSVENGSITKGVHGGSRTKPGKFGAKASKLLDYLTEKHYGVKLSDDDFHRLTLWLDCNSEFLGAYEHAECQARGEVVRASLE